MFELQEPLKFNRYFCITPDKALFSYQKILIFFLISPQLNHMFRVLLMSTQNMFSWSEEKYLPDNPSYLELSIPCSIECPQDQLSQIFETIKAVFKQTETIAEQMRYNFILYKKHNTSALPK